MSEPASGLNKPTTFLAESVYDGVKSKLRRLQEEIRGRDETIARMNKVWGTQGTTWNEQCVGALRGLTTAVPQRCGVVSPPPFPCLPSGA